MKIGQHLTKLEAKYSGTLIPDAVYIRGQSNALASFWGRLVQGTHTCAIAAAPQALKHKTLSTRAYPAKTNIPCQYHYYDKHPTTTTNLV